MASWQDQARAFIAGDAVVPNLDEREVAIGAIAGKLARIVVERLFGGPQTTPPAAMLDEVAEGCRAFLAAYEAEMKP